ncbi:MAG: PilZ domain-containing protein [Gammaproteobacteria bacterium]|nr:PilZ domain-containing protein [Gammaproteobacteria bacterium]
MDKRKSPRREVSLKVRLDYQSGSPLIVQTRDISEGGLFLILGDISRPPIGEVVTVEVLDAEADINAFPSSEAVVVREESMGIGLAFIEMDLD